MYSNPPSGVQEHKKKTSKQQFLIIWSGTGDRITRVRRALVTTIITGVVMAVSTGHKVLHAIVVKE